MTVQFARWGNSVAVRIPADVLREIGLKEGGSAELNLIAGKLVLSPVKGRPVYSREELLAGITKENCHETVEWGPPVGSEVW